MTSTPRSTKKARRPPAWAVAVPVAVLSVGLGAVALLSAPGATTIDGSSFNTTFVIMGWWWATYALLPLAAALAWWVSAARPGWSAYLAAGVALVLPQMVVAAIVVARYQLSGWGSGLEFLSFLHPIGLLVLTLVVLTAVGGIQDARRPMTTATSSA